MANFLTTLNRGASDVVNTVSTTTSLVSTTVEYAHSFVAHHKEAYDKNLHLRNATHYINGQNKIGDMQLQLQGMSHLTDNEKAAILVELKNKHNDVWGYDLTNNTAITQES